MKGMTGGKITTRQIIAYMSTGKLPKAKSEKKYGDDEGNAARAAGRHSGGRVGGNSIGNVNMGGGSRTGHSRSDKSIAPSETLILAKKGEYVINSKSAAKMGTDQLDAINAIGRHSGGFAAEAGGLATQPMGLFRAGTQGVMESYLKQGTKSYNKAKKRRAKILKARKAGLGGGGASMKGVDPNGWNKPWAGTYGNGGMGKHDWPLPENTQLYAPHSGTLTAHSKPGYESRRSHGGNGFQSYGQWVTIKGGGTTLMMAHMNKLPIAAGKSKHVSAGQGIGLSGQTGNAEGAHVHMERIPPGGNNSNAGGFFSGVGVKLKTGGTVRYDNTPAILHKDESVLTAPLTSKMNEAVDRFADNSKSGYNGGVTIGEINIDGKDWTPQDIPKLAKEIKKEFDKDDSRQSRRPK